MSRRYRALLVGNWHYPDDPGNLPDLKGPMNDVAGLGQVLTDRETGLFGRDDVTVLTERASHEIAAEMEAFFADASRDDLLLVYYSGHGITADDGSLLLCGRNARTDRKLATTVSAETVNRMIRGCAAAAVVIMLDCCHSGAFKSGDLAGELAGRGRFVLTASRARDRAPDADHATGLSRFTGHLLGGLRGGAALPGADHVTLSDLYRYVHRRMTTDGAVIPQQRFDGDGEVTIARLTAPSPPRPGVGVGVGVGDSAPPGSVSAPVPSAPTIFVSESFIDVGEVWAGEVLPVERVTVTARGPDGALVAWTATTEADWVRVRTQGAQLEITVTPRADATRANVVVCNTATGETRTVRVAARLRPAAPSAPSAPIATAAPIPTAAPAASEPARDLFDAVFTSRAARPPEDPRPVVFARFDQAWTGERLAAAVRNALRQPGLGDGFPPLTAKKAQDLGGLPPNESMLLSVHLDSGDEWVVFTDRACYWLRKNASVAVAYREFPLRTFRAVAASGRGPVTHVDLGDGVPRLAGVKAEPIHAVLIALQERFRAG